MRPDHPRSRGEYLCAQNDLEVDGGSSPLSRGIPLWKPRFMTGSRIIPALAGNTANDD